MSTNDQHVHTISCARYEYLIEAARSRELTDEEGMECLDHEAHCPTGKHLLSTLEQELGLPAGAFENGAQGFGIPDPAIVREAFCAALFHSGESGEPGAPSRPRSSHSKEVLTSPGASPKHEPPSKGRIIRLGPSPRRLTVNPWLPKGVFCPMPLRLAALRQTDSIQFGQIRNLRFGYPLPELEISNGAVHVAVTTPFRAQVEYICGRDTRVPIPLAPQDTKIVTWKGSQLWSKRSKTPLNDFLLARCLGGAVIGVADSTSAFATRLKKAAASAGFHTEKCSTVPRKRSRDPNVLYLLVGDFERVFRGLVSKEIDGAALVEPFPTFVKFHLGTTAYVESHLARDCTSATSGFCCVVVVPGEWADDERYAESYNAFLTATVDSIFGLITEEPRDEIAELLKTFTGIPILQGSHDQFDPATIAKEAARRAVRHLTAYLVEDDTKSPELLIPEVSTEAVRAEAEALCCFLSQAQQKRFRQGMFRMKDLESKLYDFRSARRLFEERINKYGQPKFQERVRQIASEALPSDSWQTPTSPTIH